eukprot:TRINITY_DN40673_c0_g1_i1.p2 TRINITY_DN40673_c0_g1~~TRINITY_DN40673_c0_g1_i1.p2  ORF type:complete len:211 (+),score=4.37 TRINITY_DN40673_c0_g1_i1:747-1379(+)
MGMEAYAVRCRAKYGVPQKAGGPMAAGNAVDGRGVWRAVAEGKVAAWGAVNIILATARSAASLLPADWPAGGQPAALLEDEAAGEVLVSSDLRGDDESAEADAVDGRGVWRAVAEGKVAAWGAVNIILATARSAASLLPADWPAGGQPAALLEDEAAGEVLVSSDLRGDDESAEADAGVLAAAAPAARALALADRRSSESRMARRVRVSS